MSKVVATKPRGRVKANGSVEFTADGFANLLSGLGAGNAKTSANTYVVDLGQQDLETAYRASTWFGKIVDIPADDATREWRSWKAEDAEIEKLETVEKNLQVAQKVRQALIWSRLYGGAVIIPGGLPGNPASPLNLDAVKVGSLKFLTVLHRWEIQAQGMVRDPLSPLYGQPEKYTMAQTDGRDVEFHPSRVIRINGRAIPSQTTAVDGGWGDSVWVHLQDAIRSSDAGASIVAALMQEAKVDVIRVPDMMMGMATADYEALMMKRFTMANMLKSISNTLLLDKEDEYDQKQVTWVGMPDVMNMLLTIMSGAADIPVTRLLGRGVSSLAASDEISLKNYYDNVKAKQRLVLGPMLTQLDELLIRSALGTRPEKVWYDWESLFQIDEKAAAEIDKLEAETAQIYMDTGLLPPEAIAKGAKNRMIESGRWPGIEQAFAEAPEVDFEKALAEPNPDEPETIDPNAQNTSTADGFMSDAEPKTLYVRRNVLNPRDIVKHYKSQGVRVTVKDLHVTVIYSKTPVDWFKTGEAWQAKLELEGGARDHELFGPPGLEDAFVLMIKSSELEWRHESFLRSGATSSYEEYQPHITLSYEGAPEGWEDLTPYSGKIVLGPEIYEEVKD